MWNLYLRARFYIRQDCGNDMCMITNIILSYEIFLRHERMCVSLHAMQKKIQCDIMQSCFSFAGKRKILSSIDPSVYFSPKNVMIKDRNLSYRVLTSIIIHIAILVLPESGIAGV